MQIKILNKGNRNKLICERKDGTVEIADLGPNLPFHDIAHFIVERKLKLKKGFYGNIFYGYSRVLDKELFLHFISYELFLMLENCIDKRKRNNLNKDESEEVQALNEIIWKRDQT